MSDPVMPIPSPIHGLQSTELYLSSIMAYGLYDLAGTSESVPVTIAAIAGATVLGSVYTICRTFLKGDKT